MFGVVTAMASYERCVRRFDGRVPLMRCRHHKEERSAGGRPADRFLSSRSRDGRCDQAGVGLGICGTSCPVCGRWGAVPSPMAPSLTRVTLLYARNGEARCDETAAVTRTALGISAVLMTAPKRAREWTYDRSSKGAWTRVRANDASFLVKAVGRPSRAAPKS